MEEFHDANRLPRGLCRVAIGTPVPLGIAYILLSPSTVYSRPRSLDRMYQHHGGASGVSLMRNTHSEALYTRDPRDEQKGSKGRGINRECQVYELTGERRKETALAARQPTKRLCIEARYTCPSPPPPPPSSLLPLP